MSYKAVRSSQAQQPLSGLSFIEGVRDSLLQPPQRKGGQGTFSHVVTFLIHAALFFALASGPLCLTRLPA